MCSACHATQNLGYPSAPNLFSSCNECHEAYPRYSSVIGEGRAVKLTATASGPGTENISDLPEFFGEYFANSGFELSDENAAEISATYAFETKEVFDNALLPEKYKVRLFKTSCKISVALNGKTVLDKTIWAKMRSGWEPSEPAQNSVHYLKHRAYYLTSIALTKVFEHQGGD